jgi:hypothetical protein
MAIRTIHHNFTCRAAPGAAASFLRAAQQPAIGRTALGRDNLVLRFKTEAKTDCPPAWIRPGGRGKLPAERSKFGF